MRLTKEQLIKQIAVANKKEMADLVIKNGKIIDVFNLDIIMGDIAIVEGMIVGIGEYEGHQVIDANHSYIAPGFIDGHVHIESSMVTPYEFAKVVVPHGVTTIITDPHEIANVAGSDGISFMLADSEHVPMDMYFMLPSCVPAASFENSGARLLAEDLEPFYSHPRVLGLAEVMDYPAVIHHEEHMVNKLLAARQRTTLIDGHGAGLDAHSMNVYRAAGIRTDHECVTAEEARVRVQRGMYVIIREGSGAKNLVELIQIVNERNGRRFLFGTDDKHLDELVSEGSIDHHIRLAIRHGIHPLLAIQMATLNAAECYGLTTKGAVAPGFEADLVLFDDLHNLHITKVFKAGKLVAEQGKVTATLGKPISPSSRLTNSVHLHTISEADLQIAIHDHHQAHIIEMIPNQIITNKRIERVTVNDGFFVPSVESDQLKLVVIERHKQKGSIGLGIVKGCKLKSGAVAATVAHDSHNVIVAGTNDRDILSAIRKIEEMNGGLVVVDQGEVIGSVALTVGGLMSAKDYPTVNQELQQLQEALNRISAAKQSNLFLTLSFMSLPVIPELKLTDQGLFDVSSFQHIAVAVK